MKGNFLKSASVLVLLSSLMGSCISTDPDSIGYGDAFIIVEVSGQDTLKGLGLHAFSYSQFQTVTVNLSTDEQNSYVLEPYMGYNQDFVWTTPRDEFSTELPAAGDYVFTAVFKNGDTDVFYDKLYTGIIAPPAIKEVKFNATSKALEVSWERSAKANAYNVKLLDADGDVLFVSPMFNDYTDSYSFGKNTEGWQVTSYPASGEPVKVEVDAYLFEPVAGSRDLQSQGRSYYQIEWVN